MDQVRTQLRDFIVENFLFGQGGDGLADGDSLMDKGIVDSTGVLELVGFLEETWGVRVEDDELVPENLDSIASLAGFVARKTSGSPAVEG